jgi:uncharacterized membrane protein
MLIVIAATLAVIPMLFFGNAWGHDFDLHLPRWMDAAQQFREGIVFPRWAAGSNSGLGDPFFIFYPPLSWTLGATLGSILPWRMVPGAYVWLVVVLAGAAMWKCASDWLDPPDAVMASLLYAVNPYIIVMVYRRCSYGELLASAFFPLLVWAAVRMGRDPTKTIFPLAIVFAAIWLADLPAGLVASYSLALLLLCNSFIHRSLRPILYGAVAILTTFLGLTFFLFPAAWERKWVSINLVLRPDWVPERNFLFAQIRDPGMLLFSMGLSFLALILVGATAIAAVLTRRLRREAPDVWRLLTVLGGVSAFLLFRPSSILWNILPELRYVEFPWRWLSPLCVAGVVLTSSAVGQTRRRAALWVTVAFAIGAIGAGIVHSVRWDSQHRHLKDLTAATHSGAGYKLGEDFAWSRPLGSHPSKLPELAPVIVSADAQDEIEMSRQGVQIHVDLWSPERKVFSVDSPRPLLLRIKLLTYPAWQAKLNGKIVALETKQETGQMLLPVPAGFTRAEIKFVRTWDRTVGMAVSLTTILALTLLMLVLQGREISARGPKLDRV